MCLFKFNQSLFVIFIRVLISLFFLLIFSNCTSYYIGNKNSAKITRFNSENKESFSFVVGEEFLKNHADSKPSSKFSEMSKAEYSLLKRFLRDNKYCFNKNNRLSFQVNSKQEKVYDITFSSLIEQSYNAKPISPATYFGECKK